MAKRCWATFVGQTCLSELCWAKRCWGNFVGQTCLGTLCWANLCGQTLLGNVFWAKLVLGRPCFVCLGCPGLRGGVKTLRLVGCPQPLRSSAAGGWWLVGARGTGQGHCCAGRRGWLVAGGCWGCGQTTRRWVLTPPPKCLSGLATLT